MNRTKIIEHYKAFHKLDEMTEDCQIDIDWMEAIIEDNNLVNKNSISDDIECCYSLFIRWKRKEADYTNTSIHKKLTLDEVSQKLYEYQKYEIIDYQIV